MRPAAPAGVDLPPAGKGTRLPRPAPRSAPWSLVTIAGVMAILAGCSSAPKHTPGDVTVRPRPAPASDRDGVHPSPPSDLEKTPNAEPRVEEVRAAGPNRPYTVLGKSYTPQDDDGPVVQRGLASWYGRKFHGRRTATGEVYDMHGMTAAHKTMPLPSYARVRNPKNGKEVIVRVNDRGPFHSDRIIDLSYTAALKLGILRGVATVEVERLTNDDIRTGAWRKSGSDDTATADASDNDPQSRSATSVDERLTAPVADKAPTPTRYKGDKGDKGVESGDGATPAAREQTSSAAPTDERPYAEAASGYWVQLGAFRQREGATQFQQRVSAQAEWLSPQLSLFSEPALYRLQAGPYESSVQAQQAVARIRDELKLVAVMVDRR